MSREHTLTAARAVVCADDPCVARVGAEALLSEGNAVDAVVTAAFAACVVNPHRFSLAGAGGFLLAWLEREGRAYAVDFPPVAPQAAKPGAIPSPASGKGEEHPHPVGARAVTVPAILAGLSRALTQFGTFPLKQVVTPAMKLAHEGFEVSSALARATREPCIEEFPETLRCFRKKNRPLKAGTTLTFPDHGALLENLAAEGPEAFYRGGVGRRIVEHLRSMGGLVSMEDMAHYRARVYPAFRNDYHDVMMLGGPASTSGSPLLFLALNILEGVNLSPFTRRSLKVVHLVVEAVKHAWMEHRKTLAHVGKQLHPFEWMAAKNLAARLRSGIDPSRASLQAITYRSPLDIYPDASSHIVAVDAEGNMVVLSQTLGAGAFGCGITIPSLGLVVNNGAVFFHHRPGGAHSFESGKRARILLGSFLALRKGRPFLAIGATGGLSATAPLVHLIVDMVQRGQTLAQAMALPRVYCQERFNVVVERTLPPMVRKGLIKMGHDIELIPRNRNQPGPLAGIQVDAVDGSRTGCIDPRRKEHALAGF